MEIAQRISGILGQGSDGWDVFYKARKLVAQGHDIIELTIGEHDIKTDAMILEAMDLAARKGHTGYAAVPGMAELRAAVAERIALSTGVPTSKANILITPGGQSALFSAHMAACNPGDHALYIAPYYATYPGAIRGSSAVPVEVEARPEDGFQPRAEAIAAKAKGATSLLINTPNNPTGVVYSQATLEGIAGVCQENDLWLISDEVYDTQIWEGQHLSPRALPDMKDRTMVVGSMSKSHAMTGSRVGWIVAQEDVVSHLQNLSTHTTYGVAGFIQMAALHALGLGAKFEDSIAEPFRRRREIVQRVVDKSNVVSAIPSQGAMYIMLDIRATGLSGEDFALRLLDEHKIAVMPGESFGNAASGHLRIALTVDDDRLETSIEKLVGFAEALTEK